MTPNDIEILIHFHCCPLPHERASAPAVIESIEQFVKDGILIQNEGKSYSTTPKGCALMEVLCATRYPTEAWVDGSGNVIDF